MNGALWMIVLLEFAGLVVLGVLLLVSRRTLATTRREIKRRKAGHQPRRRRQKPLGVAPLA